MDLPASVRLTVEELARFEPDIVHLASPFLVGGPALAAAEDLGVPVVAVYPTNVAQYATRYGLGFGLMRVGERLAWRRITSLHARVGLTLAPSRASMDELRRHGVPRVRL